jgi:hypothetical protein
MSIYRILCAVAAAALGAAVVMALPGFSPDVEAGTSAPAAQLASVQVAPVQAPSPASDCTELAWPYAGLGCQREHGQASGPARVVRLVTTDRLPK